MGSAVIVSHTWLYHENLPGIFRAREYKRSEEVYGLHPRCNVWKCWSTECSEKALSASQWERTENPDALTTWHSRNLEYLAIKCQLKSGVSSCHGRSLTVPKLHNANLCRKLELLFSLMSCSYSLILNGQPLCLSYLRKMIEWYSFQIFESLTNIWFVNHSPCQESVTY